MSGYKARELCLSASASGYGSCPAIRTRSSAGRERSGEEVMVEGGRGFARVPDGGGEIGLDFGREMSGLHAIEPGIQARRAGYHR